MGCATGHSDCAPRCERHSQASRHRLAAQPVLPVRGCAAVLWPASCAPARASLECPHTAVVCCDTGMPCECAWVWGHTVCHCCGAHVLKDMSKTHVMLRQSHRHPSCDGSDGSYRLKSISPGQCRIHFSSNALFCVFLFSCYSLDIRMVLRGRHGE